jgi:hypothetical protein
VECSSLVLQQHKLRFTLIIEERHRSSATLPVFTHLSLCISGKLVWRVCNHGGHILSRVAAELGIRSKIKSLFWSHCNYSHVHTVEHVFAQ